MNGQDNVALPEIEWPAGSAGTWIFVSAIFEEVRSQYLRVTAIYLPDHVVPSRLRLQLQIWYGKAFET